MKTLIKYFTLRKRIKNKINKIEKHKDYIQTSFILAFMNDYYDPKHYVEVKQCEDKIKLLRELL